tara:strand:- start:14 stop:406 length:393 start_codon:yes stop_codon:yes gene_type:complete
MKTNTIKDFLIIHCIGRDDKLGLRINKDFFVHNLENKKNSEKLVSEILNFLSLHKAELNDNFSVIVNQGPGSFSGIRISLAVAKGLEITKKIKLYGYINSNLDTFTQENIEKMFDKNLVEKKLIKPIYLS